MLFRQTGCVIAAYNVNWIWQKEQIYKAHNVLPAAWSYALDVGGGRGHGISNGMTPDSIFCALFYLFIYINLFI